MKKNIILIMIGLCIVGFVSISMWNFQKQKAQVQEITESAVKILTEISENQVNIDPHLDYDDQKYDEAAAFKISHLDLNKEVSDMLKNKYTNNDYIFARDHLTEKSKKLSLKTIKYEIQQINQIFNDPRIIDGLNQQKYSENDVVHLANLMLYKSVLELLLVDQFNQEN